MWKTSITNERNGSAASGEQSTSLIDPQWERIASRLGDLQELEDAWDGPGTKRPSREILESAQSLLSILKGHYMIPPSSVAPGPEGSVALSWSLGGMYLEAEITSPDHAEWFLTGDDGESLHWEGSTIELAVLEFGTRARELNHAATPVPGTVG